MKLNQMYQILLFSGVMLFYCNAIRAMDMDTKNAMQKGKEMVDRHEIEIRNLQQLMNQFNELQQSVDASAQQTPSNNQMTSQSASPATSNEQAEALKNIGRTLSNIEYNMSYSPGVSKYHPTFTQDAKPGIMGMIADTIRNEREAEFRERTRDLFDWVTKSRSKGEWLQDVAYMGLLGMTIPMMTILAKKGMDLTLDVIKYKLTTPAVTILRPETKYGRMDRIKRWWNNYQTPPMIFDDSVKNRLEEIEAATKNIRDHIKTGTKKDVKYRNLLLYGKPGTGKTLFATILADKTDMDFLSVSAGDLLQSGAEGKKYFDDLVEMANRSKYGTIIFIDEADGLFIDRDTLLKAKALDHLVVLNHILGATGTGSDKYMLIAATNNAYSLDPAMGRRFQDRVEMPLPNEATRVELLNLYIKNKLPKTEELLTPEKIQNIASKTEGLSHAEISDMITAMSTKADTNKDGRLTASNIESAIAQAIEKMKAAERDRKEFERKTQGVLAAAA